MVYGRSSVTDAGNVLSARVVQTHVIAIGASTGGTEAIFEILRQLPAVMPGIVITQHMPEGFTRMYAERLNRLCALRVKEAADGDRVQKGLVLIAPGNLQMRLVRGALGYQVTCRPGEKISGHRPSVDALFSSVADTAGRNAVGILLTGMGSDGAQGLLKMKKRGAYTIGQDKASSVVYGMPMAAWKMGAVTIQAPCARIPAVLMQYLKQISAR